MLALALIAMPAMAESVVFSCTVTDARTGQVVLTGGDCHSDALGVTGVVFQRENYLGVGHQTAFSSTDRGILGRFTLGADIVGRTDNPNYLISVRAQDFIPREEIQLIVTGGTGRGRLTGIQLLELDNEPFSSVAGAVITNFLTAPFSHSPFPLSIPFTFNETFTLSIEAFLALNAGPRPLARAGGLISAFFSTQDILDADGHSVAGARVAIVPESRSWLLLAFAVIVLASGKLAGTFPETLLHFRHQRLRKR